MKTGTKMRVVQVREESVVIPTFEPLEANKNPLFLENRVYQGSSGKVYPLPSIDRISEEKVDRAWQGVWMENDFIRILVLPEIGGRIHIGEDKTNGYDFFYRQSVIKPALVGLAGPWISGGVEFNWPQHHRPATFMPVSYEIEEHEDGSKTIWCSDHDPMNRMKGMHGVCLHPDRAIIELKVRAYNRTSMVQTFLWWANVATRVHEDYQSFFPPDVHYVADHAKRAMSEFPLCKGHYYGVDYGARAKTGIPENELPTEFPPRGNYPANDLSWYANIPVPTSYMAMGSKEDFFGGYDHAKNAGLVHVANHHISPGKKQWTWGNHEFGYAWDRHLTETDGPYIELMAGVYTDNQPDFSFLNPGETKTWSQFWYPIQKIGPAHHANHEAALHLKLEGEESSIGVSVTGLYPQSILTLMHQGRKIFSRKVDLSPGAPSVERFKASSSWKKEELSISVVDQTGKRVIEYQPRKEIKKAVPPAATEPLLPHEIKSIDELYITGLHLDQYRHATRGAEKYWKEALKRDEGDSRCNLALGVWHFRRGEFNLAEKHLRKSIERQTRRNPNPYDGEAYYHLGLVLRFLNREEEAYDALYKSVWNMAWQSAGYHALAEIDAKRKDWNRALEHLNFSLRMNTENLRARNLKVMVLRKIGDDKEEEKILQETRQIDPLDLWSSYLAGHPMKTDSQTRLDFAYDFIRSGFEEEALKILLETTSEKTSGTAPLIASLIASIYHRQGEESEAKAQWKKAESAPRDYCFPSRLEEIVVLEEAIDGNPNGANAFYYLGNLYYDRRRHREAISLWEKSAKLNPKNPTVWRNLGIGYYNIIRNSSKAKSAYEKAFSLDPDDARIFYERDQLWKRIGITPKKRLREFEKYKNLVESRDDLSVELATLYNQVGKPAQALKTITSRAFQPWEGGEGQALGQYTRAQLKRGRELLAQSEFEGALSHFEAALQPPRSLGETRHLLSNPSEIWYWIGKAHTALGNHQVAREFWGRAAAFKGDFQNMSVQSYSELTYYSGLSMRELGKKNEAKRLFHQLMGYARQLEKSVAKIDYFATSLPTMLLFEENLQERQMIFGRFMMAQSYRGLGELKKSSQILKWILECDPNHPLAQDF